MANKYLIEHVNSNKLALFDEHVRDSELAQLKAKIEEAITMKFYWGHFGVWWNNKERTHTRHRTTHLHNDEFLRALLWDAQHSHKDTQRTQQVNPDKTNVQLAFEFLYILFAADRDGEKWKRKDWQLTDVCGPHSHRES